jgi:C1A family cysteine protease
MMSGGTDYSMRKLLPAVLFPFTVVAFLFFSSPAVFGEELPVMAPPNPAFLQYMSVARPLGVQNVTPDGHGLGYIPSPIDRSYLAGQSVFPERPLGTLPSSYDLRDHGKVSPVKNQLQCGDCWAFATMASLESNLLAVESWDFSENNLKNTHGFDWGACDGGNGDMSTAYLARWDDASYQAGPVLEAADPYNQYPPYTSPAGLSEQKHVQEVLMLPPRTAWSDNDNIKQALMDYGGVWTSYYASGSYSDKSCPIGTCRTYYYSGSAFSNHAVTIVGWDDTFPSTSFTPNAPGNGAFIIKNSWGTGWGVNGGYFYISYYDSNLGYDGSYVFNGAEPVTKYSRVYQYDPLGALNYLGWLNSTTGWFANVFTAAASEDLAAVSFYTYDVNASYFVYVYTNVASLPTSGSPAAGATTTGSFPIPGYHTVTLNSPVSLTAGQKFSVVVEVTNSTSEYSTPMERPFDGYSSGATASAGQSYVSSSGSSWTDLTAFYANTNVCLKAFTTSDATPPPAPISLSATPATWTNTNPFSINWTNPSDPSGIAGAYYKLGSAPTSDGDGTYTTSKPFSVSATAQNGQSLYVWLKDGAGNKSYLNRSPVTLHYDSTAPSDGTLTAAPGDGQVSLNWSSGFSDSGGSGLRSSNTYKVVRSAGGNPAVRCTSGTQVYLGTGTSMTNSGLTNGATYYYRACAYDNAGNISTGALSSATLPVHVTVTTSPIGRQFTVGGTPYTTARNFTCPPGEGHAIGLLSSTQSGGAGTQYVFSSWSDGGAQNHTINPVADSTYTAGFTTQYKLTTAVSPPGGGTVGPDCGSGCWYNSGSSAGLLAGPGDGYIFSGWSGCSSDPNPSTTVAMNAAKSCTANFSLCADNPAQNQRTSASYTSLGAAYGNVGTLDGDTIRLLAEVFTEVLDLSRDISVTLKGGYGCGFSDPASSSSIIDGSLTIGAGKVTLDGIVIR